MSDDELSARRERRTVKVTARLTPTEAADLALLEAHLGGDASYVIRRGLKLVRAEVDRQAARQVPGQLGLLAID